MADFQLVHKLREESKQKFNESTRMAQKAHELQLEVKTMKSQIQHMELEIDSLTYNSHRLRNESDKLNNQAFVMSLGEAKV